MNVKSKYSSTAKIECAVPQGSILGPLLFLLYVNDMKETVGCDLYPYADDSCLVYQHNDVSKIEHNQNKNFSNICDWFVNNKLSIYFEEDKIECILFGTKQKLNKTGSLNIRHGTIQIKQYHAVTYLGLDENLSGENMALKVISKFLYRKNRFLYQPLCRLLCNALIQSHFNYVCSAWYPNLNSTYIVWRHF